jgi:hypothetical protein
MAAASAGAAPSFLMHRWTGEAAMKKTRLDLDSLSVESFDTTAAPEGRGTVHGNADTFQSYCSDGRTCIDTCDYTCNQYNATCGSTCVGSCEPSGCGTCVDASCGDTYCGTCDPHCCCTCSCY